MSGSSQGDPGLCQKALNPLPPTDEELLIRFRDSGDRDAINQLVNRYQVELFSYLRRRLGDAELAEDTFQTTFTQVYLKAHLFDKDKTFKPWLYAIALNQSIDCQRRNKRHRMISLDQPGRKHEDQSATLAELSAGNEVEPYAELDLEEKRAKVREVVERLPDTQRAVIELIYYQKLKYRETADALGVPIGTVKSRFNAAITKLNEMFGRMEWFRE